MGLDLIPIFAAEEPSKVPFYVAGAVLAGWAVLVSVIGIARAKFPGGPGGQVAVMAITAVLVVAATGTAVATATKHHAEEGPTPAGERGPGEAEAPPESGQEGGTSGFDQPEGGGEAEQPEGGGEAEQPQAATSTLEIAANPDGQLAFEQSALTARAGEVTIDFTNQSPVPHDVRIERDGRDLGGTDVITGSEAQARVELEPGEYVFFCSVNGHRQAGMEGQLTVE